MNINQLNIAVENNGKFHIKWLFFRLSKCDFLWFLSNENERFFFSQSNDVEFSIPFQMLHWFRSKVQIASKVKKRKLWAISKMHQRHRITAANQQRKKSNPNNQPAIANILNLLQRWQLTIVKPGLKNSHWATKKSINGWKWYSHHCVWTQLKKSNHQNAMMLMTCS